MESGTSSNKTVDDVLDPRKLNITEGCMTSELVSNP